MSGFLIVQVRQKSISLDADSGNKLVILQQTENPFGKYRHFFLIPLTGLRNTQRIKQRLQSIVYITRPHNATRTLRTKH